MPSFSDALRNRLGLITQRGEDQTTWEKMHNARQRQQSLNDQAIAWQQAMLNRSAQSSFNTANIPNNITRGASSSGSPFDAFMQSIARKESGGNYGAVNKHSGALGKYQIMPSNINGKYRGWDYNALGYDVSTSQFLNSPDIQEKVARYQLQQYYNRYGPAGASIAWYAGPGAANKFQKTGYVSNVAQGLYPSIASYMLGVVGGLR